MTDSPRTQAHASCPAGRSTGAPTTWPSTALADVLPCPDLGHVWNPLDGCLLMIEFALSLEDAIAAEVMDISSSPNEVRDDVG